MLNTFIITVENEIKPIFEKIGATLSKVTPSGVTFSLKNAEISIWLEREIEVYATVQSLDTNKTVYLSEILSDYLNSKSQGIFHSSDSFTVQMCVRSITNIITTEVVPLIFDGRINEVISAIVLKRKEGLDKYYENIAEKEAKKAFVEKRYDDVILHYSKIKNLNDVQKKRLNISLQHRGRQ